MSNRLKSLAALVAGMVLPLAFAPWSWFAIGLLAPAVLFYLWLSATPKQALWYGWLFGFGLLGVGVSWVYISMHDFSNASVPVAGSVTLLFVSSFALYMAFSGWLAAKFARSDWQSLLIVFPIFWVCAEWTRGTFFTGFAWLNLGYSQIDSPLSVLAPVLGVYGVSWVTAMLSGLLVLAVRSRGNLRWVSAASVLIILTLCARFAEIDWTQPSGNKFSVALVQGNIHQDEKWLPQNRKPTLDLYRTLTEKHQDADVVIWPETAVPVYYHEIQRSYLQPLADEFKAQDRELILGVPYLDQADGSFYNAMLTLGEDEVFYFKRHLVPFGEIFPFQDALSTIYESAFGVYSSFSSGDDWQPLPTVEGHPVSISICYEIIFGEEIIQTLPEAELLVNTSNDAWFGDSIAPQQHLEIARMRALETGRYLVRATNTGISAIISPFGDIEMQSPQFEQVVLEGEVLPMQGATPYVRIGNTWMLGLPILLMLSIFFVSRRTV